ncbi:N-formylglutamate deformylase [Neopusillimonas maritima]|jgi:N-formylglutamate deformylase|uniref:N-formylglutamate deformylase n=1 Tax=Neopusillimonas maritima TaxID=2026239 RepID=A0ABX9MUV4_9BURK|nr:N-formylglutamate deformylase [Neopusillimonas maritima]RII82739.1 N-formylglutamate deformylase [Neopusillimonas maritima]
MTASEPLFKFRRGTTPLLVSMPHTGIHIPNDIRENMSEAALRLPDTDWHLETLYDFLDALGASVIVATHSRYVIDLNRPKDNANLYPGQDTTGLCPIDTFHRDPVYLNGYQPDSHEISRRVQAYWTPYHEQLNAELDRLKQAHGVAPLWDAHSICSRVPRFFEGSLPDLNIGTANGSSCNLELQNALQAIAQKSGYTWAVNGRFKGGHITRKYGQPSQNIHAVQLELSEATYMQETHPYPFDETLAQKVRPTLKAFLTEMLNWADKLK